MLVFILYIVYRRRKRAKGPGPFNCCVAFCCTYRYTYCFIYLFIVVAVVGSFPLWQLFSGNMAVSSRHSDNSVVFQLVDLFIYSFRNAKTRGLRHPKPQQQKKKTDIRTEEEEGRGEK